MCKHKISFENPSKSYFILIVLCILSFILFSCGTANNRIAPVIPEDAEIIECTGWIELQGKSRYPVNGNQSELPVFQIIEIFHDIDSRPIYKLNYDPNCIYHLFPGELSNGNVTINNGADYQYKVKGYIEKGSEYYLFFNTVPIFHVIEIWRLK